MVSASGSAKKVEMSCNIRGVSTCCNSPSVPTCRCGPCRLSTPVVKDVMNQYKNDIDVVEVCTDDLPEIAAVAGVVSIPTIQLYFQGQILDTIVGCVARNVLASSVEKVLEDTVGSSTNGDDAE